MRKRPHQQKVVGRHGVACHQAQVDTTSFFLYIAAPSNAPAGVLRAQALVKCEVAL